MSDDVSTADRARAWWARARAYGRRVWARPLARAALLAVGALVVLPMTLIGLLFAWFYLGSDLPSATAVAGVPEATVVLDAQGDQVATLEPATRAQPVTLGQLPPHVVDAVLAAEDRGFRSHGGVSLGAMARAALTNLTAGEVRQGASTITQQYVSLARHTGSSWTGKLREAALAVKLDRRVSKTQILERYLNIVPLGRGARGIDAAARTFFGMPATELDVNQAATLAGMLAAPSAYDPGRHPDRARTRRDYVLSGMVEQGWLSRAQAAEVRSGDLPPIGGGAIVTDEGPNGYFLDTVRAQLPGLVDEPHSGDISRGLVVETTLDQRLQALAQELMTSRMGEQPDTGALVSVDPSTGAARAVVGGRGIREQQFNAARRAVRQPGSSFKAVTLTAYLSAGNDPEDRVEAPRELSAGSDDDPGIRNYGRRGYGEVTVRRATVDSINTAYVNLAREVGFEQVADLARRLGIDRDLPAVPSLTLGAAGVTPLELAEVYATLAAQGMHHDVHTVTRVTTADGEILYEREEDATRIVEPDVAAAVTEVLAAVVEEGTGRAAALDRPTAGKTGTTNDYRDAWFAGFVPQLATVVWFGNQDNSPLPEITGGDLPAETWSAYMREAVAPLPVEPFPAPTDTSDADEASPSPSPSGSSPSPSPTASPSPTSTPMSPRPSPPREPGRSPAPEPSPSPSDDDDDDGILPVGD